MGFLRSCMFLLVLCIQLQLIVGKPFLFDLYCDLVCDDDYDVSTTTSTSTSNEDEWDMFGICNCGPRRPPGTRRRGQGVPSNINMRLPPSQNGMNFSMTNTNGMWSFNLDAGPQGPQGATGGAPPAGPPPAGAPPAGSPPAGAAPAAGAATTAAPTTAKP